MLQQGRARAVGSLRAQLDTGGGAVVDDFQIIRLKLSLPSCSFVSVEEDFLVVPTLTAGLIILGMTFLQANCILDLPGRTTKVAKKFLQTAATADQQSQAMSSLRPVNDVGKVLSGRHAVSPSFLLLF